MDWRITFSAPLRKPKPEEPSPSYRISHGDMQTILAPALGVQIIGDNQVIKPCPVVIHQDFLLYTHNTEPASSARAVQRTHGAAALAKHPPDPVDYRACCRHRGTSPTCVPRSDQSNRLNSSSDSSSSQSLAVQPPVGVPALKAPSG